MNLKAHALALARRGMRVFPLAPMSSKPLLSKEAGGHGCLDGTTDAAQIAAWWDAHPTANIGFATGGEWVVIDLDVKHPPTDGIANWWRFCALWEINVQPTVSATTPTGGVHLYYRKAVELGNSAGKIAPGIDVRADGGYVVVPPSVREMGVYKWGSANTLLDLPAEVLNVLAPPARMEAPASAPRIGGDYSKYIQSAIDKELDELAHAVNGEKHYTLTRVAFSIGSLVGSPWANVDRGEMEAAILQVLQGMQDIQSMTAAEKTMRDCLDAGEQHPRLEPPTLERNGFPQEPPEFRIQQRSDFTGICISNRSLVITDDPTLNEDNSKGVLVGTRWDRALIDKIVAARPSYVVIVGLHTAGQRLWQALRMASVEAYWRP